MNDARPRPRSCAARESPSRLFLKHTEDFERVKRDGVRVTTGLFNVVFCASRPGRTRIGIVVGRRFGNAVSRNRGKRRFRALATLTSGQLRQGHDMIIFPKRRMLTVSHPALRETWVTTLTRQGLMAAP